MLSYEEWIEWFADVPDWISNTKTMLERCMVVFDKKKHIMPKYPLPVDVNAKDYLISLCEEGLKERVPLYTQAYLDRLQYEIDVISQMQYEDYFLIVQDFMKYAKRSNILTGPGRGSSASSLVAYTLYITDVDPLQYGLLFERFLNPERITMPDIDIDFADSKEWK